ncbi:hypothetical protein OXPF_23230 [Oxobacter pfennigii]|uniref:Uncharacterized protein n=1 Tax=Oxobacter pfennigii TaxID=36849 RepID=A0A0P8X079_9CLOT|nr:hypothetical protein [Oxobacter pfennigii]KPU44155.1 hypothetical protein OXPF_23230 [Oxobacter pfennigii]
MKNKLFFLILLLWSMLIINPIYAHADMGPKPSVVINFEGLEGKNYFVTLLSEIPSTGPHSALGEHPGNQRFSEGDADYEIWQKFNSYKDEDGFYFLQYFNDCNETSQFIWGYYPPPKFKILLYFPVEDSFAVSDEAYERYAFDSYFKVDVKNLFIPPLSTIKGIEAVKNYDYTWELVSMFIRIIATIAIEIFLAFLFGFRAKKQLFIIGTVNIITQSILNILLNLTNYSYGSMLFVFNYIWMELLIFFIEAFIYSKHLHKYADSEKMKKRITSLYAFVANAASFGAGIFISIKIPGIF